MVTASGVQMSSEQVDSSPQSEMGDSASHVNLDNDSPNSSTPLYQFPGTLTSNSSCTSTSVKKKEGALRTVKERSIVWNHFTKFNDENGRLKARCNYCNTEYHADTKTIGTSSMRTHMKKCLLKPYLKEATQTKLVFQSELKGKDGKGTWYFDEDKTRKALSAMIFIDEQPFSMVEREGFKFLMSVACSHFHIPSRSTVTRDCYQLYLDEKSKLKKTLKTDCVRICLTIGTWTSRQKINYLNVTGHYVDKDWKLHKKVLSFCPITSHKGDELALAIDMCLLDWGIDKVFTVTVDNSTSNDTVVSFLRKRLSTLGTNLLDCKYLHMRCAAHAVNLVVQDGIKEIEESVNKIRRAVRYVIQSPARLKKFKECAVADKIECKRSLCLDVCTRWDSTYLMLDTAQRFEKAFESYALEDMNFKNELWMSEGEAEDSTIGTPKRYDWSRVRNFVKILEHFYEFTLRLRVSGSSYVTCNTIFHEMYDINHLLREWADQEQDLELSAMAMMMRRKYDKYWGSAQKMNMLVYIAVVLDPRYKLGFLECLLPKMCPGESIEIMIRDATYELFFEYKTLNASGSQYTTKIQSQSTQSQSSQPSQSSSSESFIMQSNKRKRGFAKQEYLRKIAEKGVLDTKSELDRYLLEDVDEDNDGFNILNWWKVNRPRFPILSQMARDILAMPVSTIARESTFSAWDSFLDEFRSSLTPRIVQALMCTRDWLRSTFKLVSVEEDIINIEKIDKELTNSGGNYSIIDL